MVSAIGSRLRQVREELSFAQKSMSSKLGLGPSTWQKIELGHNMPSGETLLRVAELGFSPSWILTGKGRMHLDDSDTDHGDHLGEGIFSKDGFRSPSQDLLAKVLATIIQSYRDEGEQISPVDMARLAADKYAAILMTSQYPAEQLVMVRLFEVELRKQVHDARVNRDARKRPSG